MVKNDLINRFVLHLIHRPEISGRDALVQSQACYEKYVEKTVEDVFGLFDHYDIRIDELMIDLGKLTPDEIPDKLYSALEKELKKHIHKKKIPPDVNGGIGSSESAFEVHSGLTEKETIKRFHDNKVVIPLLPTIEEIETPVIDDPLSYFFEYLKNPQIPWYLHSEKPFDIEMLVANVIDKCLIEDNHLRKLVAVISRELRIYHRFVRLVKTESLNLIIHRYIEINNVFPDSRIIYADLYDMIEHLLSRFPSYKKEVREWFFECLLFNLPTKKQIKESGFETDIDHSQKEFLLYDSTGAGNETMYRQLQQLGFLPKEIKPEEKSGKNFVKYLSRIHKNNLYSFQSDSRLSEVSQEDQLRFFIANAGLVVFNPFIPAFFRQLELLDKEEKFKSIRHRIRAVHLLQVLTGVQSKHYEHLLPFNKIICGLDPGFPVDPAFRVTKREKEEAAGLLESVISHWSVLQGTSVSGFQEAFVQREGIIEKSGSDWIVHVENKSIDILLDDLPWSINLLSFPWNEYVIHVDWKK